MGERLPIVFVPGASGRSWGVNGPNDDPLDWLTSGTTDVRIAGATGPQMDEFPGPLLDLANRDRYEFLGTDTMGGQWGWLMAQEPGEVPPATIWFHRFYDTPASTFPGDPRLYRTEAAAEDLLTLVKLVLNRTGAPRVHLVAHSLGGLLCRSMIERVIPNLAGVGGYPDRAPDMVDSLFTYATPHGGIELTAGSGDEQRLLEVFGIAVGDTLGPTKMWRYLTPGDTHDTVPPEDWDPRVVPVDAFPTNRIFCLVGTRPADEDSSWALSTTAAGVESDGLVKIENAVVPGARHGYVYRSHRGRYGIVNSEEGYQTLRRFLLGDVDVQADLIDFDPEVDSHGESRWQVEVGWAVRGLAVLLDDRTAAHSCALDLDWREPRRTPLGGTGLLTDRTVRPRDRVDRLRCTVRLRVVSLRRLEPGITDKVERTSRFVDNLVIDVGEWKGGLAAWTRWASSLPGEVEDYQPTGEPNGEAELGIAWKSTVPLPPAARSFGEHVALRLIVRDRHLRAAEQLAGSESHP